MNCSRTNGLPAGLKTLLMLLGWKNLANDQTSLAILTSRPVDSNDRRGSVSRDNRELPHGGVTIRRCHQFRGIFDRRYIFRGRCGPVFSTRLGFVRRSGCQRRHAVDGRTIAYRMRSTACVRKAVRVIAVSLKPLPPSADNRSAPVSIRAHDLLAGGLVWRSLSSRCFAVDHFAVFSSLSCWRAWHSSAHRAAH